MSESARGRALRVRSNLLVAAVSVVLFLSVRPALADDIPVIQGDGAAVGAEGRQSLTPPGDGFTDATASSSDQGVVQVETPEHSSLGGWGAGFTVKGKGVGVVTVTWKNPKTGEERKQYFIVNSGGAKIEHVEQVAFGQDGYAVKSQPIGGSTSGDKAVQINVSTPGIVQASWAGGGGGPWDAEFTGRKPGSTLALITWIDKDNVQHVSIYAITVTAKPADPPKPANPSGTSKPISNNPGAENGDH